MNNDTMISDGSIISFGSALGIVLLLGWLLCRHRFLVPHFLTISQGVSCVFYQGLLLCALLWSTSTQNKEVCRKGSQLAKP